MPSPGLGSRVTKRDSDSLQGRSQDNNYSWLLGAQSSAGGAQKLWERGGNTRLRLVGSGKLCKEVLPESTPEEQ